MVDTTKTRAELVSRALGKLGVVGSGQSPEAEDTETIDSTVDAVLSDLAAREVYFVSNDEEIDIAAFEWLAIILANFNAEDFGKPMDAGKQQYAENMLRVLRRSGPTYERQVAEYF